uniref:Glycine-rich RNA-binding protein 4 n=1 Tax=Rhizophora mucronata TaxID=61149 RepID=A0A2P2LC75_RHIMU
MIPKHEAFVFPPPLRSCWAFPVRILDYKSLLDKDLLTIL